MIINIQKAEEYLIEILPKVTLLSGEINTVGTYLLFNKVETNNALINDVTYRFNCYIAIATPTGRKSIIYDELNQVFSCLIEAQQQEQVVDIKSAKPFSSNRLIIYQLDIGVTPPLDDEFETGENL